jgi:hypothetical protein
MVMQAADLRNLNHLPKAHLLDRSELWRILLKRQVGAILVVIVKIAPEDSPRMRFPENNGLGCRLQPIPQMSNTFG